MARVGRGARGLSGASPRPRRTARPQSGLAAATAAGVSFTAAILATNYRAVAASVEAELKTPMSTPSKWASGDAFELTVLGNGLRGAFERYASKRGVGGESTMPVEGLVLSVSSHHAGNRARGLSGDETRGLETVLKKIFKRADGGLNLTQYLIFHALMTVPSSDYEVAFRLSDGAATQRHDGTVTPADLGKVVNAMLKSIGVIEQKSTNIRIADALNTGSMDTSSWKALLSELRTAVGTATFRLLDVERKGSLDGESFARFALAHDDQKFLMSSFDSRIRASGQREAVRSVDVQLNDFLEYQRMLQDASHVSHAVSLFNDAGRPFDKKTFRRLLSGIRGARVSDPFLDLLFFTFDVNGDGQLDSTELGYALRTHTICELEHQAQRQSWLQALASCTHDCVLEEAGSRFRK